MDGPWFYRDDDEWNAFAERLKLMPCPHCKVVGMLIRHGFLHGYDEASSPQRNTVHAVHADHAVRGRRIFCSNRNSRSGCGRTFSVWLATKIRRLGLTTGALWRFLQRAVADTILAAVHASKSRLSERTWQRIWRRFQLGQSKIRTALLARCQPPDVPPDVPTHPPPGPLSPPSRRPTEAHVLAHLQAAFSNADCPIAAFQQAMRTFFI